jgi:hypothetical protein
MVRVFSHQISPYPFQSTNAATVLTANMFLYGRKKDLGNVTLYSDDPLIRCETWGAARLY